VNEARSSALPSPAQIDIACYECLTPLLPAPKSMTFKSMPRFLIKFFVRATLKANSAIMLDEPATPTVTSLRALRLVKEPVQMLW